MPPHTPSQLWVCTVSVLVAHPHAYTLLSSHQAGLGLWLRVLSSHLGHNKASSRELLVPAGCLRPQQSGTRTLARQR